MKKAISIWALFFGALLVLFVSGCEGSIDLTGSWSGTLNYDSEPGTDYNFNLSLTQSGSSVSGNAFLIESGALPSTDYDYTVSGEIDGTSFTAFLENDASVLTDINIEAVVNDSGTSVTGISSDADTPANTGHFTVNIQEGGSRT